MDDYFRNFNEADKKIWADFLAWQTGATYKPENIDDFIMSNAGDDYNQVLLSTSKALIVLSNDFAVTILDYIYREDFTRSESYEIEI
jgi:hypothetical protein